MKESPLLQDNVNSWKNFLRGYISKTYPEIATVFGAHGISYIINTNIEDTIYVEKRMSEAISDFDTSKHISSGLYSTNPTEYFKKARDYFTQEDLNIPQNYEYINHALNYHPQQLMIFAQQIGKSNKQNGAYYLFKTLKLRRLIFSEENRGRDPSKPLISRCPVGSKVEEIIRYMKENQES